MEKSTTFIYGLVSTRDLSDIRYVGKTIQRLSNRLYEHLQCHKGKNTYKQSWIKQQQKLGYDIKIILIDEVWSEDWEFWEMFWIQEYFRRGNKLTNLSPGGVQPNNLEEVFAINSNNKIVKKFDSISEADRYYNIPSSVISNIISKKTRHKLYQDITFVRVRDYDTNKDYGLLFIRKSNKPIYQFNLDGEFISEWRSAVEASKELNVNKTSISCVLSKVQKTAGGFQWSYKPDNMNAASIDYKREIGVYKDNLLVGSYDSIANMCRMLGLNIKYVNRAIYERKSNKYKGYRFERLSKL